MKILMLNMQGSGVGYYRHWLPAKALQARGHEVEFYPNTGSALAQIAVKYGRVERWFEETLPTTDIIHTGYSTDENEIRLLCTAREYAAKALGRNIPLLTDIDDDIQNVPPYNAAFGHYHGGSVQRKIARFHLQVSDAVTVSTAPLAQVLAPLSKKVYHLPNCFEDGEWTDLTADPNRAHDQAVRLIFNGGPSRVADYDTLQTVIEGLMERYDGQDGPLLRLLFLACAPSWATKWMEHKTDPTQNRAFFLQPAEVTRYWGMLKWTAPDIMVNPLTPNKFNESKSCIKAWDAILAGSAFVGSDLPTHDPIPDPCMLKCTSPLQWAESLSYLIENPDFRAAKALKLREWGLANYHIRVHIDKWERAYEECAQTPVIRRMEDTAGG